MTEIENAEKNAGGQEIGSVAWFRTPVAIAFSVVAHLFGAILISLFLFSLNDVSGEAAIAQGWEMAYTLPVVMVLSAVACATFILFVVKLNSDLARWVYFGFSVVLPGLIGTGMVQLGLYLLGWTLRRFTGT